MNKPNDPETRAWVESLSGSGYTHPLWTHVTWSGRRIEYLEHESAALRLALDAHNGTLRCRECDGSGSYLGHGSVRLDCPKCQGAGLMSAEQIDWLIDGRAEVEAWQRGQREALIAHTASEIAVEVLVDERDRARDLAAALEAQLAEATRTVAAVKHACHHDRDCEEEGEGECCFRMWRRVAIMVGEANHVTAAEQNDADYWEPSAALGWDARLAEMTDG